jgi:hypothetical protein
MLIDAGMTHDQRAASLVPTAGLAIAAAIMTADERGYRPHETLFQERVQHLLKTPPKVLYLHEHWETWLPTSSVARAGF